MLNTINPAAVPLAKELYSEIRKRIDEKKDKIVISLYGGSGCGKTTLATIIKQLFEEDGIGCYVLSGDHYPKRIPKRNDEERMRIYQERETDGLVDYLGTPNEIEFDKINKVITQFKAGQSLISLKQMGREDGDICYVDGDFHDVQILLIEWTHGGSEYLTGVDLRIYIDSAPEGTLENRLKRNRDENAASDLIRMVLEIEQTKLLKQAKAAKLVVDKDGGIHGQ